MIVLLFVLIIVLVTILCLAWRLGSRTHALPCPVWMKWLLDPTAGKSVSPRTKKTIRLLQVQPGMKILDAGCGPGRLTIPLAKETGPQGSVTAMDMQEGMLHEVRKRAKRNQCTNITCIRGGIGDGFLPADHYDRVVLITVLGEIPDREAALRELYYTLRPGGILLIEETIRDPHYQKRDFVSKLAGTIGFIGEEFNGNRFSYILLLKKPPFPA